MYRFLPKCMTLKLNDLQLTFKVLCGRTPWEPFTYLSYSIFAVMSTAAKSLKRNKLPAHSDLQRRGRAISLRQHGFLVPNVRRQRRMRELWSRRWLVWWESRWIHRKWALYCQVSDPVLRRYHTTETTLCTPLQFQCAYALTPRKISAQCTTISSLYTAVQYLLIN